MKQIIIALLFLFLVSCSGKDDAGIALSGVFLNYVDSNGNRLFSAVQDGQNGYWIDSVKVYDLSDGKRSILSPCFENSSVAFTIGDGSGFYLV